MILPRTIRNQMQKIGLPCIFGRTVVSSGEIQMYQTRKYAIRAKNGYVSFVESRGKDCSVSYNVYWHE